MKSIFVILLNLFVIYGSSYTQTKFSYGVKAGLNNCSPNLQEFEKDFPTYRNDPGTKTLYGTTLDVLGLSFGAFTKYNLINSERIAFIGEVNIDVKGYKQKALNTFTATTYKKTHLDLPLLIKVEPFQNFGLYLETGIYYSFILSNKTEFPAVNANSSEFEKRRALALTRETNLSGVILGLGYSIKDTDLGISYKHDKQYDYVQLTFRYQIFK
jgi:hypothetical protein